MNVPNQLFDALHNSKSILLCVFVLDTLFNLRLNYFID